MQQESKGQEALEIETSGLSTPKVIFDGNCDHYYQEVGLDPEGVMLAQCTKCPMGRRYKVSEYGCQNGRIEHR